MDIFGDREKKTENNGMNAVLKEGRCNVRFALSAFDVMFHVH